MSGKLKRDEDLFSKTVYGIGYFGKGSFNCKNNLPIYRRWHAMFSRCYSQKTLQRSPKNIGCSVHPDWHNFQIFAAWSAEQIGSQVKGFALDKDILIPKNKVYGPENCVFIPSEINSFYHVPLNKKSNNLPTGVSKRAQRFLANWNDGGRTYQTETFNTVEQAFAAYSEFKVKRARILADKWESYVDPRVCVSLRNFKMEDHYVYV